MLKNVLMLKRVSLLALFVMAPATADAGGFYLSDIGARGMGRAGAFVANPDNVLALHYNPAGLSLLKGLHVELSLTTVLTNVKFERTCPCLPADFANQVAADAALEAQFAGNPAESNTTIFIPFLGLAYGFDFLDTTVGLALWGPNSGRFDYGALPEVTANTFPREAATATQRYSGVTMANLEANFGLGFGIQPIKGLRIGFTAIGYQTGADQTQHLWANSDLLSDEPEDVGVDVPVLLSFKENFAMNWLVGASYEIIPGLSVGSSFRGQRNVRADGKIKVGIPAKLQEEVRDGVPLAQVGGAGCNADAECDITAELEIAPLWRIGTQYVMPGIFTAEAAFVYERWSSHDQIVIRPQNVEFQINLEGQEPTQLPKIIAPRNWRDTWSIRLGGEVHVFEQYGVNLRGGYFYEPSAIPPEEVNPSRVDLDKHGFSFGVAGDWRGVQLEVSAMFVALQSAEVRNSNQKLTAPLDGLQEQITTVGNGNYSGRYFLISTGLTFRLGEFIDSFTEDSAEPVTASL